MSKLRTTITGLTALIGILASVIGIPVLLTHIGGAQILPAGGWTELQSVVAHADTKLLLVALKLLAWAAWASWTISVLVAGAAVARHTRIPTPTLALPGTLAAGRLIAAVLAMLTLTGIGATTHPATALPVPHHHNGTPTATATAGHTTSHPDTARPRTVTVHDGDTLSAIAKRELGDATRYPEIFTANKGKTSAGHRLTDPDRIYTGQTLTIPTTTPTSPTPPATATRRPPTAPSGHQTAAVTPPGTASPGPTPPPPPGVGPTTTSPDHAQTSTTSTGSDTTVRTTTGLGSIAAAAALTLLYRRRARQSRACRPGRRIALPTGTAAITEAQLRAAADPLTVDHLDRALRTLAHIAGPAGLPRLRAARITPTAIELYLVDDDATLPAPASPLTDDPGVWHIDRATLNTHLLDPATADGVPAPYPTLVALGHDEHDAHLLINLEEIQALGVTGDTAGDVLAAVTLELIGSPWAAAATITLVGVLPEMANHLDAPNVTYTATLDDVLPALEHCVTYRADAMTTAGTATPTAARAADLDGDTWAPHVIITTQTLTPSHRDRLTALLHTTPRTAIAAITNDPHLGEWALRIDTPTTAILDPAGLHLTPQRLPADTLTHLLAAFHTADQPDSPGPAWTHTITPETTTITTAIVDTPKDTVPHPVTTLDPARPALRLLGPIDLLNPRGPRSGSAGVSLKILTHIALNPGGHQAALDEAVWPGQIKRTATRTQPMSITRRWVGHAPDGHPYLCEYDPVAGYRLAPDMQTDWHLFQNLVGAAIADTPTQHLADALHLVDGPPLSGITITETPAEAEMRQAIRDVAHELATRFLTAGMPHAATWAATKGLHGDNIAEVLWRHLIRAAHATGDHTRLTDTITHLTTKLETIGLDPDPETLDLIHALTRQEART